MKKGIFVVLIVAVIFGLVFGGITLTKNLGKTQNEINEEEASTRLERLCKKITSIEVEAEASSIDLSSMSTLDELPPIEKYPLTVNNTTDTYIEVFSSPEKAGKEKDGWLNEVANKFNSENFTVDGKVVSVAVRSISSGLATDYITSGKYVPEAFTPSNYFWGQMLVGNGVQVELINKKMVGNVAGVTISNNKYNELMSKYGSINMKTIVEAVEAGEIIFGYTDPFSSTGGLNSLLNTLYTYDANNILSETAIEGFNKFQKNVPFIANTTLQMRDAADSGELDGFILEAQLYNNSPDLQREYQFIPFGARHDNPLYAVGELSSTKKQIISLFSDYCMKSESQELATKYGFNQNDDYVSEMPDFTNDEIIQAQKIYKKNKGAGKPTMAVFISDISGSMQGERIENLKKSLINSIQYINNDTYIGMVSFNEKVYINLPIKKFDLTQKSLFKGATESLSANGSTATFDGIAIALNMIVEAMKENPDVTPMLFLLSDGENNRGCSLSDVAPILDAYHIPVYTIGYEVKDRFKVTLENIAAINEATFIDTEPDDIVYKLKSLFNSQM